MEIIINFKNYKTGKETLKLARKIQRYIPRSIICVPAIDLREISQRTKLKVFTQHVDINSGTGYVNVDHVRKIGIKGTLINHFENKIDDVYGFQFHPESFLISILPFIVKKDSG